MSLSSKLGVRLCLWTVAHCDQGSAVGLYFRPRGPMPANQRDALMRGIAHYALAQVHAEAIGGTLPFVEARIVLESEQEDAHVACTYRNDDELEALLVLLKRVARRLYAPES